MKHVYKVIGVLIILYSFTVGMLVPLTPGIIEVTPPSAKTGETIEVGVVGYNSNYLKAKDSLRAWLKLNNEKALAAKSIQVENETKLNLQFDIPEYLPSSERVQDLALVIDNSVDGTSVLPSAVFITQDSVDKSMGEQFWKNDPIENLSTRDYMTFPFRSITEETIRNTYFHVSLWFAMMFMMGAAVWHSIKYLRKKEVESDIKAVGFTQVGVLFGLLGLVTGMVWAQYTWGSFWSWDIKQNTTAIALLIYLSYFVLRNSFDDQERQARISSVYSIFAFVALILLLYVIPRMTESLHPGNGGNPGFGGEDLDNTMRMVFYPAIIGWTLFGVWVSSLIIRADKLKVRLLDID
ncbi:MAG: cytochrome c biogenesis protein CcsA [Bacteroidota bacterium]